MLPSPMSLSSARVELKPSSRSQVLTRLPSSACAMPAAPSGSAASRILQARMSHVLQVARGEEVLAAAAAGDVLELIQRLVAGLMIDHLAAQRDPVRRLDLLDIGRALGLEQ